MIYGIRERRGFISISGEVGTGKTTLIYSLLGRLDESVKTVHIFHTKATFEELLKNILLELEVPNIQEGKIDLLRLLNEYLIQKLAHGENLAVIIDEAQNLSPDVLEELRMLSNLETPKTKLLQIVLVGQPELETKLNSEELRQLKQRIGIRRRISRLNEEESREYIDHRLKLVGSRSSAVFTPEALSQIRQYAGGIPRIINILCDSGFLIGYGLSKKRIDASIIQEVIRDMEGSTWANSTPPEPAAVPSPAPSSTPLTVDRGLSAAFQPSTVDRGLSAAFQPSTVDRRLWTILFKPSTVDRRPWTILFKPLTVDRWPHMIFSRVSLLALLFVCLSLVAYLNREYLKVASAPPQPKPSIHQPVLPRPNVAPAPGIKAVSSASVLPSPTPTASNRGPSSITGSSSVDRGPWTLFLRPWTLLRPWTVDRGPWTAFLRPWTLLRPWTVVRGPWTAFLRPWTLLRPWTVDRGPWTASPPWTLFLQQNRLGTTRVLPIFSGQKILWPGQHHPCGSYPGSESIHCQSSPAPNQPTNSTAGAYGIITHYPILRRHL